MTFSKRLLCLSGIWPLEIRDSLFISFILYGFIFNILALLDMIKYIKNFRYVLANVMENMAVVTTVTKILMLRIKCRPLSQFLVETKADYTADNYNNDEERSIFFKYNNLSYTMIILLFPWTAFLLFFYYFKIVIPNIIMVLRNATSEYKLPYKIKPLLEPYNAKSYAFGCIHEFLRIIMIISGYLGTDCFFTSTGLHLSGQLAVLKCKVKNVLNDTHGSRQGIRKIILGHHRLIRLVDLLEDSFNIIIGQHLFGTTILLCISSYRMLSSLAVIETAGIITFVVYAFFLMCKLFIYCYVGEALLEESSNLCDELYFCEWYELSMIDMKSIWICMMRTSKPLKLTCAKFSVLSVRTFTDIVNKSMAYLSFLRTAL
ncbi:odorant receptor 4-like [Vespula pensylvanica]|uniref:odorant receptor 4-like n=1 Tax=Vespula pensylvanica TaxID=30213 RepID=UPI001CB9F601|nr:odorant receptor 4-like [Vespula pensylvanica]